MMKKILLVLMVLMVSLGLFAYDPQTWTDPDTEMSASRMNTIEGGIDSVEGLAEIEADRVDDLLLDYAIQEAEINNLQSDLFDVQTYVSSLPTLIEIDRADYIGVSIDYQYSFTTEVMEYITVLDYVTNSAASVSLLDTTTDYRSRVTVKNESDGGGVGFQNVVSVKGDNGELYYLFPGETAVFCYDDGELIWASAGWELVYSNAINTGIVLGSSFTRGVIIDGLYRFQSAWSGFAGTQLLTYGYADASGESRTVSNGFSSSAWYTYNGTGWNRGNTDFYMRKAWLWHNGE